MNKKLIFVATLAMMLLPAALAMACPMCKDSIPHSEAERAAALPTGFGFSVYCMLGGLFVSLGLATGVIAKGIKTTNDQMKLDQ